MIVTCSWTNKICFRVQVSYFAASIERRMRGRVKTGGSFCISYCPYILKCLVARCLCFHYQSETSSYSDVSRYVTY